MRLSLESISELEEHVGMEDDENVPLDEPEWSRDSETMDTAYLRLEKLKNQLQKDNAAMLT